MMACLDLVAISMASMTARLACPLCHLWCPCQITLSDDLSAGASPNSPGL